MHKLEKIAWGIAVAVIGLVVLMSKVKLDIDLPFDNRILPKFNAVFNSLTFVSLLLGGVYIKRGDIKNHNRFINVAMCLSGMFLVSYVLYHFTSSPVKFGDINGDGILSDEESSIVGSTKWIYLFILATHIILAAVILPFTLVAYVRGYLSKQEALGTLSLDDATILDGGDKSMYRLKHKKLVKIIYPLWLYVALTGPIVYLMLSKYY